MRLDISADATTSIGIFVGCVAPRGWLSKHGKHSFGKDLTREDTWLRTTGLES